MQKTDKHKQRGSALLLTLGVLSLALILAMSFAFSSRTNRQIAVINADQVKAKLLAESGWERIRASMEYNFGQISYDSGSEIYSKDGSYYYPPQDGRLGFSSSSKLSSNGYEQRYTIVSGPDTSEESFNQLGSILSRHCHLVEDLGITIPAANGGFQTLLGEDENNNEIVIGRLGFLILEEGAKFDINQLVSNQKGKIPFIQPGTDDLFEQLAKFDEAFDPAEDFYYNILGDYSTETYSEAGSKRLGLAIEELVVAARFDTHRPEGYSSCKAPWFSYEHLQKKLGSVFSNKRLAYRFFSGREIEAYWDVDVADYSNSTERQRFDITGFEWREDGLGGYYDDVSNKFIPANSGWEFGDGGETSNSSEYAVALVDALVGTSQRPEFWDNSGVKPEPAEVERVVGSAFPADFGIPALRAMSGSYPTLNKQVAANLVDYCDSDSWATKPSGVTWNSTDEPEYIGNEKVPYFNEVTFKATAVKSIGSEPDSYEFRLHLVPSVELVNIFTEPEKISSRDFRLRVIGTYHLTGMPIPATNFNIVFDFDQQDVNAYSYYVVDNLDDTDSRTEIHSATYAADITDAEYTLTIEKIILISGNKNIDHQICDFGYWSGTVSTTLIPGTTGDEAQYACLEAKDPRINHRPDNWAWKTSETPPEVFGSDENNNTLGDNNSNFKPQNSAPGSDPSKDIEEIDGISPSSLDTFSTAYIRNGPMETLWELGAIHRGEPYQTINLKKFSAPGSTGGYDGGDALLLDQVKIGPAKIIRGKYNANARNPQALADLLSGIANADYQDLEATGGASVDKDDIKFLGNPSPYRGAFTNNVLSELVESAANDREAEAYIGKTAQLLTTRHDAYTVIVVAQALQDLTFDNVSWANGPEEPTPDAIVKTLVNPTKYTLDSPPGGTPADRYCSILATQLIQVHVVRNAWRNSFEIVQQRILEE
ncbi:MAG: hypothetical protein RBT25_08015 [Lentisphaeria bacterium]|nr:hypothetical protein [Lentisphaeria bacterium]